MILEEFDPSKSALINPWNINAPVDGFPKTAVSCFSEVTFQRLVKELKGEQIAEGSVANMKIPIYQAMYRGTKLALFMADVGAPACVGILEDVFCMGVEKVVLFGTCGVLNREIGDCAILIPDSAVRDEGTSFHYAPPSDEIAVNRRYRKEFTELLEEYHCSYTVGKVWTTDAFYRETREKVEKRREMGCICVDMECSAVAALAEFREKQVFQFFYAADNLDHEKWEARSLSNEANVLEKDRIALLAVEMARKIDRIG